MYQINNCRDMRLRTRSQARDGLLRTSDEWYTRYTARDMRSVDGWRDLDNDVRVFYWFNVLISEKEFLRRMNRCSCSPYMHNQHRPIFAYTTGVERRQWKE
jgi:hypothetical protein